MPLIKPKNSPFLHYYFYYKNKRYSGSTRTANRALANQFELQARNKVLQLDAQGFSHAITLSKALKQVLATQQDLPAYRNFVIYCQKLLGKKNGTACFGFNPNQDIHEITSADVQRLITARKEEGNKDQTIKHELTQLKKTIDFCKRSGYAVSNIDFASLKKENNLKPPQGKLVFLTEDEEHRLLAELSKTQKQADLKDFVVALLHTGARYSEIANLKWQDINLQDKSISLYRPKVRNQSKILMSDKLFEVLSNRSKATPYVFTNQAGDGPRNYTGDSFARAVKRAGIEKPVTQHVLRKTYASRMVQNGIPLMFVSKLLGHTTSACTEKHYACLVPEQGAELARAVLNGSK